MVVPFTNACAAAWTSQGRRNVNSQPFMRWRDRFEFVHNATLKAERETGERKDTTLTLQLQRPK